jgi:DNA repair protein RecO (recombination protein O)
MTQMLRALVLRRRDAGESDRALTLLTEERGLVEVVAKGARKVGSRLAGCSEPLAVCELEVAKGKAR